MPSYLNVIFVFIFIFIFVFVIFNGFEFGFCGTFKGFVCAFMSGLVHAYGVGIGYGLGSHRILGSIHYSNFFSVLASAPTTHNKKAYNIILRFLSGPQNLIAMFGLVIHLLAFMETGHNEGRGGVPSIHIIDGEIDVAFAGGEIDFDFVL